MYMTGDNLYAKWNEYVQKIALFGFWNSLLVLFQIAISISHYVKHHCNDIWLRRTKLFKDAGSPDPRGNQDSMKIMFL